MEKILIKAGDKDFLVQVADREELRLKGLQDKHELPDNKGMLFVFDKEDDIAMWMEKTYIPLDIIFIDSNRVVTKVEVGEPESLELLEGDSVKYVLELNEGSGVKIGDRIDLSELDELYEEDSDFDEDFYESEITLELDLEKEDSNEPMLILDERGRVQMQLEGGERIFSRKNTRTLISMAKKAHKNKTDSDYKSLGKKLFAYLKIQDEKEEDYVEIK